MNLSFTSLHKHQTHKETLIKFLLLVSVLITYFLYLSFKFDLSTGFLLTAVSWSFFVLCTPVADAGFLLDFPIRIFFGIRMIISEIVVWALAIIINIIALLFYVDVYQHTFLTEMFKQILLNPWPYWGIIAISGLGTFLSIYFGDEMLDVTQHKDCKKYHKHSFKYRLLFIVGFMVLIIWSYYYLIDKMGVELNGF